MTICPPARYHSPANEHPWMEHSKPAKEGVLFPNVFESNNRQHATMSVVLIARMAPLAMSFYTKPPVTFSFKKKSFLPQMCIVLEAVLLKTP